MTKGWKIVQALQQRHYLPFELAAEFAISLEAANFILTIQGLYFGPGGKGVKAFAKRINRAL